MTLPQPATARKLAIRFVSSWGGPNPGAAEIEVYAVRPADAALGAFIPGPQAALDGSGPPPPPTVEESAELAGQLKAGRLGFTKLVVAQRHHIHCVARLHLSLRRPAQRRRAVRLRRDRRPADPAGRFARRPDPEPATCPTTAGRSCSAGGSKSEYYQVYTINVDGTDLRQLTDGDAPQLRRRLAARRPHRVPLHADRRRPPTASSRRSASCTR